MMYEFYRDEDLPTVFQGTTENTWRRLRYQRKGPPFLMVGRVAYYRAEDVKAWAFQQAGKTAGHRRKGGAQ